MACRRAAWDAAKVRGPSASAGEHGAREGLLLSLMTIYAGSRARELLLGSGPGKRLVAILPFARTRAQLGRSDARDVAGATAIGGRVGRCDTRRGRRITDCH